MKRLLRKYSFTSSLSFLCFFVIYIREIFFVQRICKQCQLQRNVASSSLRSHLCSFVLCGTVRLTPYNYYSRSTQLWVHIRLYLQTKLVTVLDFLFFFVLLLSNTAFYVKLNYMMTGRRVKCDWRHPLCLCLCVFWWHCIVTFAVTSHMLLKIDISCMLVIL